MKKFLFCALLPLYAFGQPAPTSTPKPAPAPAVDDSMLATDGIAVGAEYSLHVRPFVGEFHRFATHMYSYTQAAVVAFSKQPLQAQTELTTGVCGVTNIYKEYVITGGCIEGGVSNVNQHVGMVQAAEPFIDFKLKDTGFDLLFMGGLSKSTLDTSQTPFKFALLYHWK